MCPAEAGETHPAEAHQLHQTPLAASRQTWLRCYPPQPCKASSGQAQRCRCLPQASPQNGESQDLPMPGSKATCPGRPCLPGGSRKSQLKEEKARPGPHSWSSGGQARTQPARSPEPGLPRSGTGAELARTEESPRVPMSLRQGRGTGLLNPKVRPWCRETWCRERFHR